MSAKGFAVLLFAVVASTLAVDAQQGIDPRVTDLFQTGKQRVAVGLGSPVLAMKDPNSGEVRGPAIDLGRALAKKSASQYVVDGYRHSSHNWKPVLPKDRAGTIRRAEAPAALLVFGCLARAPSEECGRCLLTKFGVA